MYFLVYNYARGCKGFDYLFLELGEADQPFGFHPKEPGEGFELWGSSGC